GRPVLDDCQRASGLGLGRCLLVVVRGSQSSALRVACPQSQSVGLLDSLGRSQDGCPGRLGTHDSTLTGSPTITTRAGRRSVSPRRYPSRSTDTISPSAWPSFAGICPTTS